MMIFQFVPSAIKVPPGVFEQLRKVSHPMCEALRFSETETPLYQGKPGVLGKSTRHTLCSDHSVVGLTADNIEGQDG